MAKKVYPYENFSLTNIKGERWKDIDGYEDLYQVSSFGRVKSLPKYIECFIPSQQHTIAYWKPTRIITQKVHVKTNSFGKRPHHECTVTLQKEKKAKTCIVHRLVYYAFVRPLDLETDKLLVFNKDGNGRWNHYKNLGAGSKSDVQKRMFQRGRSKSPFAIKSKNEKLAIYEKSAKSRWKTVIQYDKKGKVLGRFESIKQASEKTGIAEPNIINVLKGRAPYIKGTSWKYAQEQ